MLTLGLLAEGETARIVEVFRGARRADARVEELGLRAGKQVHMLANGPGAVLVKVDESRIAVDRSVAMRITVRR